MPTPFSNQEHAVDPASLLEQCPWFVITFKLRGFGIVQVNAAAKRFLDPSRQHFKKPISLGDLVGISSREQFEKEILPNLLVMGSWTGTLAIRNFQGSERPLRVSIEQVPITTSGDDRLAVLFGSTLSPKSGTPHSLLSDEDMLHALLESLPGSVYFKDKSSRFLRVSRAMAESFGTREPADIIGKTDFDFFTIEHAGPAFRDEQAIIKSGTSIVNLEERETYGDGRVKWVNTTKLPFKSCQGELLGTFGISHDITARKEAEEALKRSEVLFRSIFEASNDAILLFNGDHFIDCNPQAERMFLYPRSELIGMHPVEVSPFKQPDGRESAIAARQAIEHALAIGFCRLEWTCLRKDGLNFPADVLLSAFEYGSHRMIQATVRDITEARCAQEELKLNESMLRGIIGSAPVGIAVARDRVILRANGVLSSIVGYSEQEIVGKPARFFYPNEAEFERIGRELRRASSENKPVCTECKLQRKDGVIIDAELGIACVDTTNAAGDFVLTVVDITERKQNESYLRSLSRAVAHSPVSIVITSVSGTIEYVNPCFEKTTGYTFAEVVNRNPRVLNSGAHPKEFFEKMWSTLLAGNDWSGELQNRRKNGELFWEQARISPVRDENGAISHFIAVKEDITAAKHAAEERAQMEAQLQLSQKLESVGRLAAGVAHEINTPSQFVTDNTVFLQKSFQQLSALLTDYRRLTDLAANIPECAAQVTSIKQSEQDQELDYLSTEIPKCIEQTLDGLRRISKIVGSLKEFSHPGGREKSVANINRAIETAVAVSRHEWKYVADVQTELDPGLPGVPCLLDEFNQVILNLIINAAHAVSDANQQLGRARGTITVRTSHDDAFVYMEVTDTGTGISPEVRKRLFEPFFTTKGIGKGTGQGLAIIRSVVVNRHGGKVDLATELGKGTSFRIALPLKGSSTTTPPV